MRWLEGPTLPVLRIIGLDGPQLYLVTAFYSARPLRWLLGEIQAQEVIVALRLNPGDPREWVQGVIDPSALLEFLSTLEGRGVAVSLYTAWNAHAKVFVGSRGVLVGSANLTMQGFGAGPEIVSLLGEEQVAPAREVVADYVSRLQETSLNELEQYVKRFRTRADRARSRRTARRIPDEDHLPGIRVQGPTRPAGDYGHFLEWLDQQDSEAASEIAARARGKGQLSGHIYRNFFGLRQYILTNPEEMQRFTAQNPELYRLSADRKTEQRIAEFVRQNATDEPDFVLEIWRTYLPRECGGRAERHGGTIGNLNRMLPLVGRYLAERLEDRE